MNIEPHLGEIEDTYRQQYLPADRSLMIYAAVPWAMFTLFFIRSDMALFGHTQLFFTLLVTRSVYSIFTLGMLYSLHRFPQRQFYDWMIFAWTLLTVMHMSWIEFVRPSIYIGHYALDVLVITVLHLIPNRLSFRIISALLFSFLLLVVLFVSKTTLDSVERDAVIAACLAANIIGFVASTRLFTYRRRQFKALSEAQHATRALEVLATTDPLTGVLNRRKFIEIGTQTFVHYARYRHSFSVLLIDLDFFKQVNDQFGHQAGDETLRQFAQLVLNQQRETDIFGRLGGEEFGLILPHTQAQVAVILGERLRHVTQDTRIVLAETELSITLSIGVAEIMPQDTDFDTLLRRADRALYRAKHGGRNRVEAATHTSVQTH